MSRYIEYTKSEPFEEYFSMTEYVQGMQLAMVIFPSVGIILICWISSRSVRYHLHIKGVGVVFILVGVFCGYLSHTAGDNGIALLLLLWTIPSIIMSIYMWIYQEGVLLRNIASGCIFLLGIGCFWKVAQLHNEIDPMYLQKFFGVN